MIIVYPMLISENVNKDIIPGLAKSIEKYILVYNTDSLVKQVNNSAKKLIKVGAKGAFQAGLGVATILAANKLKNMTLRQKGSKLTVESVDINEQDKDVQRAALKYAANKKQQSFQQQTAKDTSDKIDKSLSLKGGVSKINTPKMDQLSLEPTWINIDTDSGAKLLGVKVVPYTVKTDSMVALLLNDSSLKTLSAVSKKYGRMILRVLFRVWRGIKKVLPGIHQSSITGDAKNDIVWANTEYKKDLFICLSQLDLDQADFKSNPGVMSKLNQLGWASMIFADDVNKRATFCMKEFGGVCSLLPYSHMYASFGKEHGQVYSDLQDAQKSTGPFFRKKSTTRRKIFSK